MISFIQDRFQQMQPGISLVKAEKEEEARSLRPGDENCRNKT